MRKTIDSMKNTRVYMPDLVRPLVSNIIGCLVRRGNKRNAQRIFLSAMRLLRVKLRANPPKITKPKGVDFDLKILPHLFNVVSSPYIIFVRAVLNAAPSVSLQSKRVGGVIYRLPKLIRSEAKSYSMVIRWIVKNSRLRKEKGLETRLANEIYDTYKGRGTTIRKKLEIYKIASLNRPFVRYLKKKPKR